MRVEQVGDNLYSVASETVKDVAYLVNTEEHTCACPDSEFRGGIKSCKHLRAAMQRSAVDSLGSLLQGSQ